jgi:hypothetical protein
VHCVWDLQSIDRDSATISHEHLLPFTTRAKLKEKDLESDGKEDSMPNLDP